MQEKCDIIFIIQTFTIQTFRVQLFRVRPTYMIMNLTLRGMEWRMGEDSNMVVKNPQKNTDVALTIITFTMWNQNTPLFKVINSE